jgi:fructuronate reductase
MDGSQKLPQRLLAPLDAVHGQRASFTAVALAVAAWVRWQAGTTDAGESFTVDDPAAAALADALRGAESPRARVVAALGVLGYTPDGSVLDAVTAHLGHLETSGARAVIAAFLGETA